MSLDNNNTKVRGNLSGTTLRVDNNADIWGTLGVSGSTVLKSTLTVNGNTKVRGNLSGSTLRIDGNADIWGNLGVSGSTVFNRIKYTWPAAQGGSGTVLSTNGAGQLTWTTVHVGNGSGNYLSLHPEYPNTTYTASGASAVGQLTNSGALGADNLYRWTTSKATLQDYWLATRIMVPKNFTHFEAASGITLRLRTATTSAANGYITFRLIDTAGSPVAVTNNAQLVSTTANTWRTNTIGNVTAGTYTGGGYIKLLIKLAATTGNAADIGNVDLRWSTTTP